MRKYINYVLLFILCALIYWVADSYFSTRFTGNALWREILFPSPEELHIRISVAIFFVLAAVWHVHYMNKNEEIRRRLVEREERYRNLFNSGNDAVFVLGFENNGLPGRFIDVNDLACKRLGYTRGELLELSPKDINSKETAAIIPRHLKKLLADGHALFETVHVAKDGTMIPVENNVTLFGFKGEVMAIAASRDISERKCAEEEYRTIIQTAMDGFWILDGAGRFIDVNDSYCTLIGYSRSELLTMSVSDIEAKESQEETGDHITFIMERGSDRFQTKHRNKGGKIIDIEVSVNYSKEKERFIVFIRDITERTRLEETLMMLSWQDGLTALANRRHFDGFYEREWKRSVRESTPLSVIMLDIDFFKQYNDIYGHQAGDDCLKKVASCLKNVIKRPADFIARYGGEEFVAVLPSTGFEDALMLADEMRRDVEALNIAHDGSNTHFTVTISAGVASTRPEKGYSLEKLIEQADKALYRAKAEGRNRVCGAAAGEVERITG